MKETRDSKTFVDQVRISLAVSVMACATVACGASQDVGAPGSGGATSATGGSRSGSGGATGIGEGGSGGGPGGTTGTRGSGGASATGGISNGGATSQPTGGGSIGGRASTGGAPGNGGVGGAPASQDMEALKRAFAELRFGMFIHFGMNTFSNDTGRDLPNQNPALFNPTRLDPGQWMDAAKAAGMKYAVLTTKHHDGFLLWDSATTTYDVLNPAVPVAGRKDVVRLFVDAARARGILPGLYFSVQDRSVPGLSGGGDAAPFNAGWGAVNSRMPANLVQLVKDQIRELLTNYGVIPFFVTDGWAWSMGHTIIPYDEIRQLIYEASPNTLFGEHQGLQFPWHDDVVYYEEPKGGAFAPPGNILASWQSQRTGHTWFWTPPDAGYAGMSVSAIVNDHLKVLEPRYCNFVPNFAPNREGLLEQAQVNLLMQVGAMWSPDTTRPPLPAQPPHLDHPVTAVAATATSTAAGSNARNAIDGVSDGGFVDHYTQTIWRSGGAAPQSLTIDLGAARSSIEMLTYLPPQIAPQQVAPDASGRITSYRISYSVDGTTFTPVVLRPPFDGTWSWSATALAGWQWALFNPVRARYVRLEALASTGGVVQVSEVDVGGNTLTPN